MQFVVVVVVSYHTSETHITHQHYQSLTSTTFRIQAYTNTFTLALLWMCLATASIWVFEYWKFACSRIRFLAVENQLCCIGCLLSINYIHVGYVKFFSQWKPIVQTKFIVGLLKTNNSWCIPAAQQEITGGLMPSKVQFSSVHNGIVSMNFVKINFVFLLKRSLEHRWAKFGKQELNTTKATNYNNTKKNPL